jgi:hypothetical protein
VSEPERVTNPTSSRPWVVWAGGERLEGTLSLGGAGVGPVLRKARLLRGKSIEEASRETRIRSEYLQALERDSFDALLGEVYIRAFIRSYSTYLGLDPSRVLEIYNRHIGVTAPQGRNGHLGPVSVPDRRDPIAPRPRHHLSWRLLFAAALVVLGVFASVGLLARAQKPPGSNRVPPAQSGAPPSPERVSVGLKATGEVGATVWIDGGRPLRFVLREDEVRSLEGDSTIKLRLDRGGRARLTVNGHALGKPGTDDQPYSATFRSDSFRTGGPSPSPSTSATSEP